MTTRSDMFQDEVWALVDRFYPDATPNVKKAIRFAVEDFTTSMDDGVLEETAESIASSESMEASKEQDYRDCLGFGSSISFPFNF